MRLFVLSLLFVCQLIPQTLNTTGRTTQCSRTVSGTTDTVLASDNSCVIVYTSSSNITLTIPSGLGTTFSALFVQKGTGNIVFPIGTGPPEVRSADALTKTRTQYSIASLVWVASETYVVSGDLQ